MGASREIDLDKFPKQSDWFGMEVDVCFHYNTNNQISGKIVGDDKTTPFTTIISLEDGRFILGIECEFRLREYPSEVVGT